MRAIPMLCSILALWTSTAGADLPAFPGAEGFGAVATGGRGGRVLHVTNLDPDGPGSLQWACRQQGARIVVFDVGGVIRPGNRSKEGRYITILHGDITIAGQTAPYPGITIDGMLSTYRSDRIGKQKGHYKSPNKTENVIVRFLRVRPTEGTGNLRVVEFYYCRRAILDHVSGSWGLDQCFNPGYPAGDDNITFQWCTIEESDPAHLEKTGENHGFGFMGSWHNSHMTAHHNLLAHHVGRAPLLADHHTEFSNNVLYNVGPQETQIGSCKDTPNRQRYILHGNYWKCGPGGLIAGYCFIPPLACSLQGIKPQDRYTYYHNDFKIFFDGNYFAQDGYVGKEQARPAEAADARFDGFPTLTRHTAEEAYDVVLASAGCFPRDAVTQRTVAEVKTGTGQWGRFGPAGGLMEGFGQAGKPKPDTDQDGMPDEWETARGLNPKDAADANRTVPAGASPGDRHAGYTYIEYYINEQADLKVAAALTEARLSREPAKPWTTPADELSANTTKWHKSLNDMVAAIQRQNDQQKNPQNRKTYNDLISAWQAIIRLDRMKQEAAPAVAELAKGLARGKDDQQAVTWSAWALGAVGPAAKSAVPALIKALEGEQNSSPKGWSFPPYGYIAWALGRIGMTDTQARQAAPTLGRLLTGRDHRAMGNAAWTLSLIGKNAEPALANLLKALGSGGYTGYFSANALAHIGAPAIPGLLKILASRSPAVRANAFRALGWTGPAAKSAAPVLIERLAKDPEMVVRIVAATALAEIAPQSKPARMALVAALGDEKYNVRVSAADALGACGSAARSAGAALRKALGDERKEVRRTAALALAKIGDLDGLTRALGADDPFVRKYAAQAIGNLGKDAAKAVSALAKAVTDQHAEVRREAILSLALVGRAARDARQELKKALQDEDYVVRVAAAAALERTNGN